MTVQVTNNAAVLDFYQLLQLPILNSKIITFITY